jgi:phosphoglucomutase
LAIKTADENGARIIFANDPDADRFSVSEKQKKWVYLFIFQMTIE